MARLHGAQVQASVDLAIFFHLRLAAPSAW